MTTKLLDLSWNANAIPAMQIVGTRAALFTFKTHMAGFVWDAAQLENNPYTFVEVKTLLDGVTVGGHKVSDTEQVLNLADSAKKLIELVQSGRFDLDKKRSRYCTALLRVMRRWSGAFFAAKVKSCITMRAFTSASWVPIFLLLPKRVHQR